MDEDILSQFGNRVKKFRRQKGLTLAELSNSSGLHPSTLSQVERGVRNLTLDNVANIAEGLAVDPYQLFLFPDHVSEPQKLDPEDLLEQAPEEKQEVMYKFAQVLLSWEQK